MNQIMKSASFSGICKIMQNKDENIKKCIFSVAQLAVVLFPGVSMTSVAVNEVLDTNLMHLDVINLVNNCIGTVKSLLSSQDDYSTRAENAQIANVLLVFSAFFDSIKQYLPDANREIALEEGEKAILVEKALKDFENYVKDSESRNISQDGKAIINYQLHIPNPIGGLDDTEENLLNFYTLLTGQFHIFVDKLSYYESLENHQKDKFESILRSLPSLALKCYQDQYYQLAVEYPDFFVFSNQKEHADIQRSIDIGFKQIAAKIPHLAEIYSDSVANQALDQLQNRYNAQIAAPLIDKSEMYLSTDGVSFPQKMDAFIPQPFQTLIFRQGIHLEHTEKWVDRQDLGKFVADTLRSPDLGSQPMLILGDPGAGKTMLSHMLAARILNREYHVIIIHLRNVVAEDEIYKQIDLALKNSLDGTNCSWTDIRGANLSKPILLIFDGYDELLQASGKTHRNYIEKIAEFQKRCLETHNKIIRTIITSRIILIDKASIPDRTPVIKLDEFSPSQVKIWCEIWNEQNASYFTLNHLESFSISEESKAWKLAKQPLLLLMLALFDSNKNALRNNENLDQTQLYYKLVKDFIQREQNKDPAFCEMQLKEQNERINNALDKVCIAAIGMYNRNEIYIHSNQLQVDIGKLQKSSSQSELQESDKLLGSFFFIHYAEAIRQEERDLEKTRAYAFLHNTFGEFLAAHYIVSQLQKTLQLINAFREIGAEQRIESPHKWYSSLMYAPLFRRPVVLKMLAAWAPTYFSMKGMEAESVEGALNMLLDIELPKILSGSLITAMKETANRFSGENGYPQKDSMNHLSIYSFNLVSISTALLKTLPLSRFDLKTGNPKENSGWNQLRHLWRFSFGDEDMASITNLIAVGTSDQSKFLHIAKPENKRTKRKTVIDEIAVHRALDEEMAYATLGSLWGAPDHRIEDILFDNGINRIAWTKLRVLLDNRRMSTTDIEELLRIIRKSLQENDIETLSCAILILRHQFEDDGLHELAPIRLVNPAFFLLLYRRAHYFFQRQDKLGKRLIDVRCVILDILYHRVTPEMDNKQHLLERIIEENPQYSSLAEARYYLRLVGRLIEVNRGMITSDYKTMDCYISRISHAIETCILYMPQIYDADITESASISTELELFLLEALRTINICREAGIFRVSEVPRLAELCLNKSWKKRTFAIESVINILHFVDGTELLYGPTAILLLNFVQRERVSVSDIYLQDSSAAVILCKLLIQYNIGDANRKIADELAELVYQEKDKLSLQLIRQIRKFADFYSIEGLRQSVDELCSAV